MQNEILDGFFIPNNPQIHYLRIDSSAASCIIGTIVVLDDGWGYRDGDITVACL